MYEEIGKEFLKTLTNVIKGVITGDLNISLQVRLFLYQFLQINKNNSYLQMELSELYFEGNA